MRAMHVVVATGTASGKTAAFSLPALSALAEGRHATSRPGGHRAVPVADQGARPRPAPGGGGARRRWGAGGGLRRRHSPRGARLGPGACHVPADEPGHGAPHAPATARLVGALPPRPSLCGRRRVPLVPGRLRRARGRSSPAAPARGEPLRRQPRRGAGERHGERSRRHGRRLVGFPVVAVADDASASGGAVLAFWRPPLTDHVGEHGALVRRSAAAETADLLTDLVVSGRRSLAFVASRRGAEAVASSARRHLDEVAPALAERVAAYRAGFLPEERRTLEARLRSGDLLGVATTSALELGIDVHGLDAVLVAGWPGRLASFWQQVGRAGREGSPALAVFVARDDPLDTYLVHHPEAVVGAPLDATVLDPDNPYVLRPHLCAAAAEWPLRDDEIGTFGPRAESVLSTLVTDGLLRRRAAGWFWTGRGHPHAMADLRGLGDGLVRVVEVGTGRLLGTVEPTAAHATVHEGAVYVHQGATFVGAVVGPCRGGSPRRPRPRRPHHPRVRGVRPARSRGRRGAGLGARGGAPRHGGGDVAGGVVPAPPPRDRGGARRDRPGSAPAHLGDHGRLVDSAAQRARDGRCR